MNALGIIETRGLAAAVEAADVAVKSANVELIGYELTKGSGFTAVKITGDVGAVNAAMQAAQSAVPQITRVVAHVTIPRPSSGIEGMVFSDETVGYAEVASVKAGSGKAGSGKAEEKKPAPVKASAPKAPASKAVVKTAPKPEAPAKKVAPAKAAAPAKKAKATEAKKPAAKKAEAKKPETKKPETKKPEAK